jgi:hypothetical protein
MSVDLQKHQWVKRFVFDVAVFLIALFVLKEFFPDITRRLAPLALLAICAFLVLSFAWRRVLLKLNLRNLDR